MISYRSEKMKTSRVKNEKKANNNLGKVNIKTKELAHVNP